MLSLAALFVAMMGLFLGGVSAQAAVSEFAIRGPEKLLISVPEAVINIQASSQKNLRVNLAEAANDEYQIRVEGSTLRIEPKEMITKEKFGRFQARRRLIEISGAAVPIEIHAFEAQVSLNKWSRDALVHVQKGRVVSTEGAGSLALHSQNGEIQIVGHQGRLQVDSYKSNVIVRNLNGDAEVANFSGETLMENAKGFLSLNQGQGSTRIQGSSGSLQFEVTKGVVNVQGFQGRVEGQSNEGPVTVNMALDTDLNIRSQKARVTIQAPANSGASLNLQTAEGDIQAPNYLSVSRDGSQKMLRGRLRGESAKGSVFVRSQEGSILIR